MFKSLDNIATLLGMDTPNLAALGFTLDVRAAARAADTTPGQILDAVRVGFIKYLVDSNGTDPAAARLLFLPEWVRDFHERMRDQTRGVVQANVMSAELLVREYLAAMPVLDDYDQAFATGSPLYGRSRHGLKPHVRPASLITWARDRGKVPPTRSIVEQMLERIGGARVRGIIPAASEDGRQRWATWWRIPDSMLPDYAEREAIVAADAVRGTVIETGERVTSMEGKPVLVAALTDGPAPTAVAARRAEQPRTARKADGPPDDLDIPESVPDDYDPWAENKS